MTERELIERTKQFALRVIKLVNALPRTIEGRSIASQLMRSGTSVAANYRAACRARPKAEFIAKLGTVEEEADEGAFWLDLIIAIIATISLASLRSGRILLSLNRPASSSKKTASRSAWQSQIANRNSKIL